MRYVLVFVIGYITGSVFVNGLPEHLLYKYQWFRRRRGGGWEQRHGEWLRCMNFIPKKDEHNDDVEVWPL